MKKGKIVIVDDDNTLITSFKTLMVLEGYENANFFTCPLDALEFLAKNEPDLVITDMMMPKMNGLEFLKKVNDLHPDVSKIVLTGYADIEKAIGAINEVGLYKYITKPWDSNDSLILTIKNGIERTYLQRELKKKIVELESANAKLKDYSHNLEEIVKQRTADLIELNSKLNSIFENCADGIIVINELGDIEITNQAFENLVGLSLEHIKSKNINSFISTSKGLVTDYINIEEDVFIKECSITNSLSEAVTPIDINFARFTSEEDTEKKFVGIIHDVTEQKESDKLRDDFIATLTHDLRTPLLAAIQTIKFFLDGSVGNISAQQEHLLATMKRSNEDLLGLVNTLLEVYKYDASKLELCKTDFNLNSLITQTYNELLPLAEKKNIEFTLNYDLNEAIKINADRGEIRRVICNLCGNAINYTNDNGIVQIAVKQQEKDLIFTVQDNGNGIPKEDVPYLFNRFSQGTSKKRSTGTGLGLYLSRQIIEAHGGKIWLETKLDKGSEFSFLLTDVIVNNVDKETAGIK